MATKKKPAPKATNKSKASVSGAKKAPAKKVVAKTVKKAAPAKPVKKAAPVKKVVAKKAAPAKKATVAKKAVPAKAPAKKAVPAKKVVVSKAKPTNKKEDLKKGKTVSKATDKKTVPAKPATKKAAAPVKKAAAAPAKPAAPAKKAAPAPPVKAAKKEAAPVKKEVPAPAPKAAAPAPRPKKQSAPKGTITKTVTTFAKGAIPARPSSSSAAASSATSRQATSTPARAAREEKKPAVIVAHRRLESKAKQADKAGKTMVSYQPEYNRSILDEPEQALGPVYRYSDEELAEFKDLILSRLDAARKELVYLQGLITRKDEAGTEDTENRFASMEDGSGAMEREQLAQLASRQIQFVNHLEKALMRIENKTYGICRVTGKLIDKARLRAVPHATLSIEAKNFMSNNKQQ